MSKDESAMKRGYDCFFKYSFQLSDTAFQAHVSLQYFVGGL